MSTDTSPPTNRRRIPRWLKVTILSLLVVANLIVLAALWLFSTGEDILATADTNSEVTGALDESVGDQLTFLVVGSDSREGLDDLTNFGAVGGARGDVIMLVRVDQSGSVTRILSVPRDLYVDIPGNGNNKINAAYAFGGPLLMVETVKANLDVEVNHYLEVDFVGFQELVDELGGIELTFDNPARDAKSGLDVPAGRQLVDGATALAYARSRSYQEQRNGSWVSVDANDIGRTARQREVITAIVRKLKSPGSITEAGAVASALARHMTIDSRLASLSAASLFWDYKGLLTGSIDGATLPTTTQTIGGASVQVRDEPEATAMLERFRNDEPLTDSVEVAVVQVLNGNGVSGAAAEMSGILESEGFVVAAIGDAPTHDYRQTTVIVPDGSEWGPRIVASLGFGVVQTGDVDNGYDAVVIVGADAS